MKMKLLRAAAALAALLLATAPSAAQRNMKTINDGWRFVREDIDASAPAHDDSRWQRVNIPHTWNTDAYVEKDYYRGAAWYRRTLNLSADESGRRIFLRFEAVNHSARVYVNGTQVGEHKGGYTSFTFDITPYCRFGGANVIAVRAENTLNDVPTISGDFTIFGGIYRDVWLISLPAQHIETGDAGSDGIYVDTPSVSEAAASYTIRCTVVNDAPHRAAVRITNTVSDPAGRIVGRFGKKITLAAGEKRAFEHPGTIELPELWSPENPNLYTVETVISDDTSGRLLDRVTSPLGFRWFSFDGERGFSLNGKPYKLNGVCRHQDQQPYGNALSDEAHRRDMRLIKEMGANFIRISHYPQDEAVIEQCDRLGLLVWEEVPVIDIVPPSEEFADVCESQLREMVRRHYNHPSVIMWGYMNEILLVTQRRYRDDELREATDRALALARRLETALKQEDPARPSVMAFHGSDTYNREGFADVVDIVGWNLYQGWYSSAFADFDGFMAGQQRLHPDKPKIVSEYGAGSDRRIHSLSPQRFDFSIEYQQLYAEHYLATITREPYIAGAAYWNFIDFGSAQRDESMPRINNKGLVYADRTTKDVYYLFKAAFRDDVPVLHIASGDWTKRTGVSVEGGPVTQPVKVYANLSRVELWMDGVSLGVRDVEGWNAVWDVPFTDGDHHFIARGVWNGRAVETGLVIAFTAVPDRLTGEGGVPELAINCGSATFYTSPESGLTWLPDREYTPGGWGYVGGEPRSTTTQIAGTDDNPLFQTQRTDGTYRFDVPPGDYEVEVLSADLSGRGAVIAHALGTDGAVTEAGTPAADPFFSRRHRHTVKVGGEGKIEIKTDFINGIKIRKL